MLALIKNGEFISQHVEGSRIDLEYLTIMPAQDGWELAHFSPAEYEDFYDDESQEYIQIETKEAEFIANYELHKINDGEQAPEGFYIASSRVELVDGEWTYVNSFAEIPIPNPLEQSITKRQMLASLIGAGIYNGEEVIDNAINNMQDSAKKAQALLDWKYAGNFVRSHDLFNDPDMLDLMGFTPESVDNLWAVAVNLPA